MLIRHLQQKNIDKIARWKSIAAERKRRLRKVRKKKTVVQAYRLNEESRAVEQLIEEGRVRRRPDGRYEVFSKETGEDRGEVVCEDTYIKLDSDGYPYPNDTPFFRDNHRYIADGLYEQIPRTLDAWMAGDEICPEIRYLIEKRGLVLDEANPIQYFEAPLWGTTLFAAEDAVLVFYKIDRAEDGTIIDAEFCFVERAEFEKTYEEL